MYMYSKYVCVHVDVTSELVPLYNVYEFKYVGRAKSTLYVSACTVVSSFVLPSLYLHNF